MEEKSSPKDPGCTREIKIFFLCVAAIILLGSLFVWFLAWSFIRGRQLDYTRSTQADLLRIEKAYEEYYTDNNIKSGGSDLVPSIQGLVDLKYLRVLPKPRIEGEYFAPKIVLTPETAKNPDAYPTFNGPDPYGNRKHPGYLEAIGQAWAIAIKYRKPTPTP